MVRNDRFRAGTKVHIYFDPIAKYSDLTMYNGLTADHTNGEDIMDVALWETSEVIFAPKENDIAATPQVGGRIHTPDTASTIKIGLSRDAFAGQSASYIHTFFRSDLYVFEQTNYGWFYCLDGVEYNWFKFTGRNDASNRAIEEVEVIEQKLSVDRNNFGNVGTPFGNEFVDSIRVLIPYDTPEWKLRRMLYSGAIAVRGNGYISTDDNDYVNIDNYNYYYNERGGSLSPVVRLAKPNTSTVRFNSRRNKIEVELVMF